jgi:monoterpene epsilon-lactone hydrolase
MHPGDAQFVSNISPVARFRRHATDARASRFSVLRADWKLRRSATVERSTPTGTSKAFVTTHPLDPDDASTIATLRAAVRGTKGARWTVNARTQFDALMEGVSPRADVTFESATVGDIPGLWVHPASSRSDEAILYLHGGWFNAGSAKAYRHLVAHVAARAGTTAFVPDYRLAPEHPFPAAVDDGLAVYRGMDEDGIRRIAITGDSAGGNLALVLASCVTAAAASATATLVGAAALSPVTDVTLSGDTYETRADADPYFTRDQVAELVRSYLASADANNPLLSPLWGRLAGLPPIRIHVGDDEVLLDDSSRYVERAIAARVDARLDIWMGMPHGFVGSVGTVKASGLALDAIGMFLRERFQA